MRYGSQSQRGINEASDRTCDNDHLDSSDGIIASIQSFIHWEDRTLQASAALDRFLASVERRAFRMAEIATSSREDALDIVQDAMLKLATSYAHKGEDEWGPLFHRIMQSKIKDWYRRTSVRNRWRVWLHGSRDEEDTQADPIQACKDEAAIDPHRQVLVDDATLALEREIQRLPMRQRQVLMLRLWEGLNVAATAKAMGCSQGSVKSHYSRAVHSLRDKLGDHW